MTAITAKVTGGTPVTVEFNMPADVAGLVTAFGEGVVYSKAVDSLTIDVQALVRRHLKGTDKVPPKSHKEIQALVDAYKPGVGAVRKSPVEKVGTLISSMSSEEKAALLKQLKAAA